MKLEDTSGPLRAFGEGFFTYLEELSGARPQLVPSSDWYKVPSPNGVTLYFRFISDRARKYPPHSIHLIARWDDSFTTVGAERGNNWFGSHPSAEVTLQPEDGTEVNALEHFVRHAFRLRSNL
jgi:hypothetical protein